MFLQILAAFEGRIHAEDYDYRQENDGWQNCFHDLSISMPPSYINILTIDLTNNLQLANKMERASNPQKMEKNKKTANSLTVFLFDHESAIGPACLACA